MARNSYPGICYVCGTFVPAGYGHFERRYGLKGPKWRVKCVKCTSGRTVHDSDPEVIKARRKANAD